MGVDELHDGDIHTQATIVVLVPPKLTIAVECRCDTVCASLGVSINSLIRNRRRIHATTQVFTLPFRADVALPICGRLHIHKVEGVSKIEI